MRYEADEIAAALDFVVDNLAALGKVASVNLSIADGAFAKPCAAGSDVIRNSVDNLRSRGVAVIASSGNGSQKNGISSPACIHGVISVGAYNQVDDKVLTLSNSAPGLDLLAPGNQVQSAGKVDADGTSRYRPFFATSAAAPHVAGAWAILKQAYPNATVTEVLAALQIGGVMLTDTNGIATPAIRVNRALEELASISCAEAGSGYWQVGADGGVFAFGDAGFYGSTGSTALNAPVVGMASRPRADGYWLAAADGGVFTFGAAQFYGSLGGVPLNQPIVDIATRPESDGYWLAAADGGIFAFNVPFHGSLGNLTLSAPVVGMAATPSGLGYWMVGRDGAVYAFGDARFLGRTTITDPNDAVVGIAANRVGNGYFVVTRKGQVVGFQSGANDEYGEFPVTGPLTAGAGLDGAPSSAGYWVTAADYNVYNFGDALHCGSRAGMGNTAALRGLQTTHWTDAATAAPAVNARPAGSASGTAGQVSGWGYDPNLANAAVEVQVVIDGVTYNAGRTSQPRPDINETHHITGTHGFSWSAPARWFDGAQHRMQVYAIDLNGGPSTLISDSYFAVANRLPTGSFDLYGAEVWGIAQDPDDPSAPVSLFGYIDGAYHDMGATGWGGDFYWYAPTAYQDGQPHRIEVWARDANASGTSRLMSAQNFLALADPFSGAAGDPLNPSTWISSPTSSSRKVDIQGGSAQLRTVTATARADANMTAIRDGDLGLTYRFENRDPGTKFRIALRANSPFTTGYFAEIRSADDKVALYKVVNGDYRMLIEGTYQKDTGTNDLFFTATTRANGSTDLTLRIDNGTHPDRPDYVSVALNYNDAAAPIAAPGTVQLSHHYSSGNARSVYVDNVNFSAEGLVPAPPILAAGTQQFTEAYTGANGTAWNTSRWTTNPSSSRIIDVQGNEGHMRVISSSAKAEAITTDVANADVTLRYRFENRAVGSVFKVLARADNPFANGYVAEIRSGETKAKLSKVVAGTWTTLGEFEYPMTTAAQSLRFRVEGSTLRVKLWPAGTQEPGGWALSTQDSTFSGPGDLHLQHSYSSGSARSLWLDDVILKRL